MQVEELKVELVHDEVNNNISLLSHNIVKKNWLDYIECSINLENWAIIWKIQNIKKEFLRTPVDYISFTLLPIQL